jgi:hypothetical protein
VRTADGTIWLVDAWTQVDLDEVIEPPPPMSSEAVCRTSVTADHSSGTIEVLRVPLDGSAPNKAWTGRLPPWGAGLLSWGWGLSASASGQRILVAVGDRVIELDTTRF